MKLPKEYIIKMKRYKQLTGYSCGVACLRMMLAHRGKRYSEKFLRDLTECDKNKGTTVRRLRKVLKTLEFRPIRHYLTLNKALKKVAKGNPLLIPRVGHWVVLIGYDKSYVHILDPNSKRNMRRINKKLFKETWAYFKNWAMEIKPNGQKRG